MKYLTKEFINDLKNPAMKEKCVNILKSAKINRMKMYKYDFPTLKINMQNIKVKSIKKIAKNCIIDFDTDNIKESLIKSLTLKNVKIIKQEENYKDSLWMFDELYFNKNRYELHILFKREEEYLDFIAECDDGIVTYTQIGKIEKLLPKDENDDKNLNIIENIDDEEFKIISLRLLLLLTDYKSKTFKKLINILSKREDLIIDNIKLIIDQSNNEKLKQNIIANLIPKFKQKNKNKLKKSLESIINSSTCNLNLKTITGAYYNEFYKKKDH